MEFLRTRVARRVLSLFVLGSLFPIAVLVALSYRAVSSQLESQSEQRLADVTDIASQSLLDRFDFFHSWLRGVGVLGTVGVGRAGDPGSASFTDVVPGGVEGLALEEDGRVRTITGTVGQLPPLGAEDGEQLATGRPLVKAAVGIDGASPSIFMALNTRPNDPDRGGCCGHVLPGTRCGRRRSCGRRPRRSRISVSWTREAGPSTAIEARGVACQQLCLPWGAVSRTRDS